MVNFIDKKGITPVVAVALLLVVAVVAVVGFETWYGTYSSGLFSNAEKTSQFENLNIQTVVGGSLYIKGNGDIVKVESNGKDCHISGVYDNSMNQIFSSDCFVSGENNIVVYTKQNVYSKKIYLSDYKYKNPCPDGYILVPGNIDLGTSNFCVMKYEAKNVSGIATSQAAETPWLIINQIDARAACAALGSGYHLITDAEWLTIARLASENPSNWNSSKVGVGTISRGWTNTGNTGVAPSTGISCLYNTGANTCNSTGSFIYKRTLNISGSMIWDFSGNVWEWDNDTISAFSRYYGGGNGWMSYNSDDGTGKIATSPKFPSLKLPPNGWNANQGMGRYFDGGSSSGTWTGSAYTGIEAGFLRGGDWNFGANAGLFALYLDDVPLSLLAGIGFRCSYG